MRPLSFARISRADVAGFMLRKVVERRFLYAAVGLSDEPQVRMRLRTEARGRRARSSAV